MKNKLLFTKKSAPEKGEMTKMSEKPEKGQPSDIIDISGWSARPELSGKNRPHIAKPGFLKKIVLALIAVFFINSPMVFSAEKKLTLMLDWFPNVDHLPIYVARDMGYFAAKGLKIKIISPSETSDGLKLAASGNVDMSVSYEPQTIIAASRGLDVKVVGQLVNHPLTTLLFLNKEGIKTPKDLIGKKIGYTVPGLMDLLLKAFADINGIDHYSPINVGFTIVPSLVSNKVDAIMGPFKTYETVELSQRGYHPRFFELEKYGIPDYEELVFISGGKTLKKKSIAVRAFCSSVSQAIEFTKKNPAKALKMYLKAVPEADKKTESQAFDLTLPYYADRKSINPAAWQKFADFALKYKIIEKHVNVNKIIHKW